MLASTSKSHRFNLIHNSIVAAVLSAPLWISTITYAAPLPKDWCGRLWSTKTTNGLNATISWDNPTSGASSTTPPANIATIPALPSTGNFATLGIHARSGTLYALDRLTSILYQYSMRAGGSWQPTSLSQIPLLINANPSTNFNKMTVTGDLLMITNSYSTNLYTYNLDPNTGALISATGVTATLTFDGQTQLPNNTYGNPPGTTDISGGDIAQDEYGDTYMVAYDFTPNLYSSSYTTTQYAYFYKLVGTVWVYKDRVAKVSNSDQFAGLAFYNDAIYVKGIVGQLFTLPLVRLGNEYNWSGNAGSLTPLAIGSVANASIDLASCGVPAIDFTKTHKVYSDALAQSLTPNQDRVGTGEYLQYEIIGKNVGDAWSKNSFIKDPLPNGLIYVPNTATLNGANINQATYPFANYPVNSIGAASGQIRLPLLGNSNVVTLTFLARFDGTLPSVQNSATIGYTNPSPADPPNCATGLNCGVSPIVNFYPSIFGTVWNDTNGSAAGTFSNIFTTGESGTNTGTANALYALLLDSNGNTIDSKAVASDGKYAFQAIDNNQTGFSIRLSTTAGTLLSPAPVAAIPTGWRNTSPKATTSFNIALADISNQDFGLSLPAGVILVKRITAINGQTTNPNDNTVLTTAIDSTATTNDDLGKKWPSGYLKGAVQGGKILPGDTIEYTIYYLNNGSADAKKLKICDPIRGKQTYVPGSMKLLPGGTADLPTNRIALTDLATDTTVDRASNYIAGAAPANCNAATITAGTDKGGVTIDIIGTGASNQPNLSAIPGATTAGTPITSYGWFRFTTKVDP